MNHLRLVSTIIFPGVVFLLSACRTIEPHPSSEGRMMAVAQDGVPCYRHILLRKGEVVTVLRKEFAYSLVRLPDGQAGYVANDELLSAPVAAGGSDPVSETAPVKKVAKSRKYSSAPASGAPPSDIPPMPSFRY